MPRDHPRSRGEYTLGTSSTFAASGSSPLSRGIRASFGLDTVLARIIPALAGNTSGTPEKTSCASDHPRSRGEYDGTPVIFGYDSGSSPLSRGILPCMGRPGGFLRIIPALAGNTGETMFPIRQSKDHPRSRGEYWQPVTLRPTGGGSSPLSRGIHTLTAPHNRPQRIIPALAGNTLVDKGFYQPDLSDLGNPLLARLRFSKSLAPRLRRPPSWRGGSSGSASEGPGRTIRVSPS